MDNQEKEYYERKLIRKRVPILEKFAELHNIERKSCKRKSELVERLLEQKYDEVQDFVDLGNTMSRNAFNFYLDEISKAYSEELSNINLKNNDELLLFLLKREDLHFLENLISLFALKSRYTRKEFILTPKFYKTIKTIKEETSKFIQNYNESNRWKMDNEVLSLDDDSTKMTFYIEIGKVFCQQFEFRLKKEPYNPGPFERKRTHYFPLDIKNIEFRRIGDNKYLLISDFGRHAINSNS